MATTKHNHTPLTQREGALAFAAAGTRIDAAGTEPAIQASQFLTPSGVCSTGAYFSAFDRHEVVTWH